MTIIGDRPKWTMKQGDTEPPIRLQVKSKLTGAAVDLTDATVTFHMMDEDGTLVLEKAAAIESPATNGIVVYAWVAGDTDTPGKFDAEFFIEDLPSGGDLRAPNNDQIEVIITENLA